MHFFPKQIGGIINFAYDWKLVGLCKSSDLTSIRNFAPQFAIVNNSDLKLTSPNLVIEVQISSNSTSRRIYES